MLFFPTQHSFSEFINLSSNEISGTIPPEISLLTNLERLDLTSNDLTGNMPLEICTHRDEGLSVLAVDCAEVSCTCCDSC